MSFTGYEEYKNSGFDWLGEIPNHWKTIPLWTYFRKVKRTGFIDEELLSVYRDHGVILKASRDDNHNRASEDLEPYQLVNIGDLVINKMKAFQGSVAISDYRGIVSPAYFVFEGNHSSNPRFLHYLMRSNRYIFAYLSISKGIRPNQWDLEPQYHSRLPLVIPPEPEQKIIADFLDHEIAKIDILVTEQEKLIELLKEKRQVVISEAVTKGLNSKVKVKDSGVAWLGKVPESWDVVRLKKITSRISSGKTPSGGAEVYVDIGVIFLRSQNVYDEGLRLEDVVRIPEKVDAEMSSSRVTGGDILLNITGGSIGRSCCVPNDFEPANVNQHVCAIRLTNPDMVSFVELFFKSDIIKKQIDYIQNGAAREGLNFEQIGNFSICIPPLDERNLLVEEVRKKIKNFNDLTSQIIESIALLQERRSALISAAVCGQIDVRTTNGN